MSSMNTLAKQVGGVLVLLIFVGLIPVIGSQIDTAVTLPASGAGSQWNSSVNTNIVTGPTMWGTIGSIVSIAALLVIIAVGLIAVVKKLQ